MGTRDRTKWVPCSSLQEAEAFRLQNRVYEISKKEAIVENGRVALKSPAGGYTSYLDRHDLAMFGVIILKHRELLSKKLDVVIFGGKQVVFLPDGWKDVTEVFVTEIA